MLDRRSSYEYEDLLACGRGELFGPGNAQLPLPPMLMFDRISEITETGGEHGKGVIRAELDVKPDLWFFGCHFKGDPVMPGCLGLDALWQMVGFFLGWLGAQGRGRAIGVGEVKFSGAGAADDAQDHLQRRHQARHAVETCARYCRWLAFRRGQDYLPGDGLEGLSVPAGCAAAGRVTGVAGCAADGGVAVRARRERRRNLRQARRS